MFKVRNWDKKDRMTDLLDGNNSVLHVLSRLGISLGFGDKSIEKVCGETGVDTETFLAIIEQLPEESKGYESATQKISIDTLLLYLHNSHDYFLGYRLPGIRNKIYAIIGEDGGNLSEMVIKCFDEYVKEVRNHMQYEEDMVFPYVDSLMRGERDESYNIAIFGKRHDKVEMYLAEFKSILIKYYPSQVTNELITALMDLFSCEEDLAFHNRVEDNLFIPAVTLLEESLK